MKKRTILIFISIVIIFFFVTFLIFLLQKPEQKYLTDIENLYSLFTPTMKEFVNSYLSYVDCKGEKYYFDNDQICFHCKKGDVCFGYALVSRTGGKKINPKTRPFFKGNYSKEDELKLYSQGISKFLNCKCNEECFCDWGVKPRLEENYRVVFVFPEKIDIKEKIQRIAQRANVDKCEFTDLSEKEKEEKIRNLGLDINKVKLIDTIFSCGEIKGVIFSNEVIFGLEISF